MTNSYRTQRVTAVDLKAGRIRIPHDTKALLPTGRDRLAIWLRGTSMLVAYDPRMGPDQERSGTIYIGPELAGLVEPDEVLAVSITDNVVNLE